VADAVKLLQKRRREIETGSWLEPSSVTCGEVLQEWLQKREVTSRSANTQRFYGYAIQLLQPLIGYVKVQDLTLALCDRARDTMAIDHKPKTVNHYMNAAQVAWEWAIGHDIVSKNVWKRVDRVPVVRREARVLAVDEAKRLLRVLADWRDSGQRDKVPYACMVAVGLLTVKRTYSEWGGMHWRDVDLKSREAALVWVMLRQEGLTPAGNSKHKRRTFELPDAALPFLQAQKAWQERQMGPDFGRTRLVFTNDLGERIPRTTLREVFNRVLAQAGLAHMPIHDLRHTGVSLLVSMGANLTKVQAVCGHSSIRTTWDEYGFLFPDETRATLNLMGDVLTLKEAK